MHKILMALALMGIIVNVSKPVQFLMWTNPEIVYETEKDKSNILMPAHVKPN